MLEDLSIDIFTRGLNMPFQVVSRSEDDVTVELVEVTAQRALPGQESFSVVFCGPGDRFLPQNIYRFEQEALGTFDLFVVPIRQDARGYYYEACCNRICREAGA
jgi:hypothetical protein